MFKNNPSLSETNEGESQPTSFNKKQLLGCLVIVLLFVLSATAVAGIFWWQKKGGLIFPNKIINRSDKKILESDLKYIEAQADIINLTKDSDGDGLADILEKTYGTDVSNKDTDGDGYFDGEELEKGHNPLGKDELNKVQREIYENLGQFYIIENCDTQTEDEILRNLCYTAKALLNKNDSYCKDDDCYKKVAAFKEDQKICSKIKDSQEIVGNKRNECFTTLATIKQDYIICDNISFSYDVVYGYSNYPKYDCYAEIAGVKYDLSICELIQKEFEKDRKEDYQKKGLRTDRLVDLPLEQISSYRQCVINVAVVTQNSSLCELIKKNPPSAQGEQKEMGEQINFCYLGIAKKNFNPELCEKITRQAVKDDCYKSIGIALLDPRYCEKIVGDIGRNTCFLEIASKIKDAKYCYKISDKLYKDKCFGEVAKTSNDIKNCQQIKDNDKHDDCLSQFAKSQDNLTICDEMRQNEKKWFCYENYAIQNKRKDLCVPINDEYIRSVCFKEIALIGQDETLCDKISKKYNMFNECYVEIAKSKQDESICNKIIIRQEWSSGEDKRFKRECFYNLAVSKKDANICRQIGDSFYRDSCYLQLVLITKNSNLCQDIIAEDKKDLCERSVAD